MATTSRRRKIYHITHVGNIPSIVKAGCLWSDLERGERDLKCVEVGMSSIKERRRLKQVACHPGTTVGEYVPFYLCPRSVMLYVLYRGNHPDLSYRHGQEPMMHFQADLEETITWAEQQGVRWAFTDRNASADLAEFFTDPKDLNKIDWKAVQALDFRDPLVKEAKQAEFLLHEEFPWSLVEKIGVLNAEIQRQARSYLARAAHQPTIDIEPAWYY